MISLYHWETNGASARVLITLAEKDISFTSHYVDLLAFEQFRPDFLAVDPGGDVPILVHDGAVLSDASYICEYLDEGFSDKPLMPADPLGRWQVRSWQKYVDDHLAAAMAEVAWAGCGAPAFKAMERDPTPAMAQMPNAAQRRLWSEAVAGYDEERLTQARQRIALALDKAEAALAETPWLAGAGFTLADIAAFSYLNYVPGLLHGLAGERTLDWLERTAARPAVTRALTMGRAADPFAIAAPGPERVRWG